MSPPPTEPGELWLLPSHRFQVIELANGGAMLGFCSAHTMGISACGVYVVLRGNTKSTSKIPGLAM